MFKSQDWVGFEHSRPGETHDLDDLLTHLRLITVDLAFRANAFIGSERTFVEAMAGIFKEVRAFGAEDASGVMFLATVEVDHQGERCLFVFDGILSHESSIA